MAVLTQKLIVRTVRLGCLLLITTATAETDILLKSLSGKRLDDSGLSAVMIIPQ